MIVKMFSETMPAILGVPVQTLTPNSPTPDVQNYICWKTANTVATTITNLLNGQFMRRKIILIEDDNTTITGNGTYMKGNNGDDWNPQTGDWIEAIYDGSVWRWSPHKCTP